MRFPSALITVPSLIVGLTACAPDDAAVSAPDLDPLRVRVAEAEMISVEKPIRVQGIVQPAREAFVSSRVMGPVIAVKASSGDTGIEIVGPTPCFPFRVRGLARWHVVLRG